VTQYTVTVYKNKQMPRFNKQNTDVLSLLKVFVITLLDKNTKYYHKKKH